MYTGRYIVLSLSLPPLTYVQDVSSVKCRPLLPSRNANFHPSRLIFYFFLPPVIWFFLFDFSYQKSTWPSSTRLSTQVTGSARKKCQPRLRGISFIAARFFFFFCRSCAEVWISFALANGNFQSVDYDQSCLINELNRTEPKNEKKRKTLLSWMGGESLCGHSVPLAQTQLTTVWLAFDFQHGSLTRSTLSAYALFMRETLTFAWNNSEWILFSSINQLLVCYCFTDILHLDNIRGRQKKRKRKKEMLLKVFIRLPGI